jgi:catechol 2,3-dioxygenase-like lactoylglutathione lyase family enzyme
MPRGLDHIVHAVRDLDAAAEFYRRAGFTVGARNRHASGTHNHIAQFPGMLVLEGKDAAGDAPAFRDAGIGDFKRNGISLTTQRGVIQITTPAAWRACAGTEPPDLRRGTRLAAVRFAAPQGRSAGCAENRRHCGF